MDRFFAVCLIVVVLAVLTIKIPSASAEISSCSSNVNPNTVEANSSSFSFEFNIDNTGGADIRWIRISRPSENFTITGYGIANWSGGRTSSSVVFTGGSIPDGDSIDITIAADTGSSEASAANWTVEVSDDPGGASLTACNGSLDVEIAGTAPDTSGPDITDLSVTDVTDSQFKVTWTTDEAADSVIQYGTTEDYGLTKTDTASLTSHSMTVDGLTKNTTYHFLVQSTDASANTAEVGDNTVVTAQNTVTTGTSTVSSTTSSSASTTVSATPTPTPTPTPKPVDRVPPQIQFETDFSKSFKEAPKISGKVTDSGGATSNGGVAAVEYSTDDGKNWLPVDNIESPNKLSTGFDYLPSIFEDGNYLIQVRAKDLTGNSGVSKSQTLIVDRLPPQVGGNLFSLGAQLLLPDETGSVVALAGLSQKITLSAVGGPISVDIQSGDKSHKLNKNPDNGLWSTDFDFQTAGVYPLKAVSVDGANNRTERVLNNVVVVRNGKVLDGDQPVEGAMVQLFYYDLLSQRFILWDGSSLSQQNPQITGRDGTYRFFAPPGKYYVQVSAPGYYNFKSGIFSLEKSTPLNTDFNLEKAPAIKLGNFSLSLSFFKQSTGTVSLQQEEIPELMKQATSDLLQKELPFINFKQGEKDIPATSLRGKMTILTFMNTWMPQTSEQLSILEGIAQNPEIRPVVVISGESPFLVEIFRKRGRYNLDIVTDRDAAMVLPLNLQSFPTHVFLDRKGVVQSIKSGVLNRDELIDNLID